MSHWKSQKMSKIYSILNLHTAQYKVNNSDWTNQKILHINMFDKNCDLYFSETSFKDIPSQKIYSLYDEKHCKKMPIY